jgi:hypothetical protein
MTDTIAAPDAGTIFEYGLGGSGKHPGTFRVSAWVRERPWRASAYDMAMSGAMMDEAGGSREVLASQLVHEIMADEPPRRRRLEFCLREQATHVSGSGVCGCIAPLSAIRVVGMVEWPQGVIDDHRARAVRLGMLNEPIDC